MEKEQRKRWEAFPSGQQRENRVAKFFPTKKSHHLFSILFLVIFENGKSVQRREARKSLKVPDAKGKFTHATYKNSARSSKFS